MSAAAQIFGAPTPAMPFEQYVTLPGVHATGLKSMLVSPRLYRHRLDNDRPETDALRVGRATHTAVLEPDRFLLDYAVWRKSEGRRFGKRWDAFVEANTGRTIITEADYIKALKIRDAVRAHPIARRYLEERGGRPELTLRWTHPRTGLACVSRLDWLCSALVDLKSARDPSPARFSTDAARLGYALQLAFYADAVAASGLGAPPVKIIAAQSVEPYDVVVYDVDEETLRIGREQYEGALDKLIECTNSGDWPGIAPSEEIKLRLPAWASPEQDDPLTFNGESLFDDSPED